MSEAPQSEKIEKIESIVKKLHFFPEQTAHSISKKDTQETFSSFWIVHVKPVINYSKELARKYNANIEVVWLSAIFHDIARLDGLEPHEEIGSEKAYDMLLEQGFDKEKAEKVKKTILTHRCNKHKPQTLEQKILATADAVSHFKTPFYLWFSSLSTQTFKEQLESGLKKIERDYNEKIFFDGERKETIKEYDILKKWFEYYLEIDKL